MNSKVVHIGPPVLSWTNHLLTSVLFQVHTLLKRNKMSNDETSLALFIVNHRQDNMGTDLMSYCTDLHCDSIGKEPKVVSKIVELMMYCGHVSLLSL